MRRTSWSLVGLLAAAFTLAIVLSAVTAARSAPNDVNPQIIALSPASGSDLPINSPLTFTFNTAMDRASVEAALSVKSSDGKQTVTGKSAWQSDTVLIFTPDQPLTRSTDYVLSFKLGAKSAAGLPLTGTDTYRLRTVGDLLVTQLIPADSAKDIAGNATITVIFNHPVVPLTPLEQQSTLPNPLSISPAITGKGEWINTSIYQFTPNSGLSGGTTYVVTVKAGLTDQTGAVLPDDVTARFSTLAPRVTSLNAQRDNVSGILRDAPINAEFSQPMDHASVEAAFALTGPGGKQITGKFNWPSDIYFTFTPDVLLDYDGLYDVTIAQNAKSVTGTTLQDKATQSFTVVGKPILGNVQPANGEVTNNTDMNFQFSAPMKVKDLLSHITISPKPGAITPSGEDGNPEFSLNLGVDDKTTYTVTFDPKGVTDIYGTQLAVDKNNKTYTVLSDGRVQFKFTIALNYPAEAFLQTSGGLIGLYSAYAPTTRVYSTHRNTSELDLSLWKISPDDLLQNVSEGYSNYTPPDSVFLRAWRVPVENPPQAARYDLLPISASGSSVTQPFGFTCPGAPPTRLNNGQTVLVLQDDPAPLNIHANPALKANVVSIVKPGVSLKVVGGPRCVDGYVWWHVQSVQPAKGSPTPTQYINGWAAEGDNKHYFIGLPSAGNTTPTPTAPYKPAPPGPGTDPLKPGVYWLTLASPDVRDSYPLKHAMIVATANITLKQTDSSVTAWVTDLKSGQPVPNVSISFKRGGHRSNTNYVSIGSAVTDANGIALITHPQTTDALSTTDVSAVLDDGTHFGIGSSTLTDGILPYDFNLPASYSSDRPTIYLYSDRSLYKPGQPVYFRGVLRDKHDISYTLTNDKTVPIEVIDDKGETIYKTDAPVNSFGTFSGQFMLDTNAPLGYYRIVAALIDPTRLDEQKQPVRQEFARAFSVAQYRTPEFQVNVTADKSQVVQGGKVRVTVDSRFFFGGAVSNARVNWTVTSGGYSFNYAGTGNYSFADYSEDSGPDANYSPDGNQVAQGSGKTDADGKFVIEVPADLGKDKQSQTYTIEADVVDESDQVVAGRVPVTIHAGDLYVGVAPEDYVTTVNTPAKMDVIAVDWNSQPLPNTDVKVRAVERQWSSVQQVNPDDGRTIWSYDVKENQIDSTTVHTDANGKAVYTFVPPRGGDYKVYVSATDTHGNTVTSSAFEYVAGPDYIPWRQRNSNTIELKADKADYKVGDTASILIPSPFQGATTAWITVERGGILKSEVITLSNNSTVYKLPIDASFAPNAFVSVSLVKGTDANNAVAAFRLGMVQLNVNADQYKLNIDVKSDKPQAGPREQVTYTVHVSDYQGKPVKAEVGAGVTDLAVLSLMPDTSTPIIDHFYSQQGLAVVTASTLTISVDQQTQTILNKVKGGGGGGPEGGIFEVRQLFLDTPLWKPAVMTDDQGNANVTLTLPDQLTTWRLDVRAVTLPIAALPTTLVGQKTFDLISTKPLLIRPITPRFFVTGDQSTLAAVVNNNTGADQQVTVKIAVKGVQLGSPDTRTLSIPAGQRARVDWMVTVQDAANVDATFSAVSADSKYSDAAKSAVGQPGDDTLPIYKYEVPETVGTAGTIDKNGGTQTEGIVLPTQFNITQGALNVRIDQSLAVAATDALGVLGNQRYDCTEQTVSRFLPNLVTYHAIDQLKLDKADLKTSLDNQISVAFQRLYNQQHVDGGWGWCVEDNSSTYVTAYALLGLSEAKDAGYTVDPDVLSKAIKYVQGNLADLGDQAATYQLNRQSFMLYVLARAGAGNVSRTVRLFSIREAMSTYARAYLAMTFYILNAKDDTHLAPLISDLQSSAIISATGQHWQESYEDYWNWNTDTRTTAIVLDALTKIQPTNPLLPNVVRWLMVARKGDSWETNQETAWSVMALSDWMLASGDAQPNYTFSASLNDKPLLGTTQASALALRTPSTMQAQVADMLRGSVNKLAITRSAGTGTLYYTAHLNAYLPVEQVKALAHGITVTRTYSLATDKTNASITQAHVGDNIRVHLNLVVANDLQYVVLDDPIPAGTESINPNLATSSGVGTQPQLNYADPFFGGWGWWWFGDAQFRDEKTVLSAEYLPAGTYEYTYIVRAGLAGTYHVIPTTAQEFYFPEVYGRSDGQLFTLLPATDAANDPTVPTSTPAPKSS